MIAALVTAGAAALAIVALITYLAHAAISRGDRAAAADVARAGLAAQLAIATANVATHQRALANLQRTADAYKEIARAQPPLPGLPPGAHGVDQLLAALDLAAALLPAEPAAGGDRPADVGGGLPGGSGPADRLGDDGGADGPATVPEAGRGADALR